MERILFMLLGLALLLSSSVQADSITTIQLMNRPAADVIPIVEPMLAVDDVITGHGFKIFLRSSPETLAQVKDMIAAIDIAAKVLRISVFQGNSRDLRKLGISGNIQIGGGNTNIDIGARQNSDDASSISGSTDSANGNISSTSTRTRLIDNPIHQLRVTEGTQGYIETGKQIAFFSGANWKRSKAAGSSIEFRDVTTGFYVLPRIHNNRVTLQVSPFKNSQSKSGAGDIDTLHANTTITGPIGEWLLIGGATEQIDQSQNSTGSYRSSQRNNGESIWIKADLDITAD